MCGRYYPAQEPVAAHTSFPLRKTLLLLLILAGLAACAWFGWNRFARWNRDKLVCYALTYAQKGDWSSALLTARQVLLSDPENAPMCRLIATIADAAGFPETILWWSRAVKANDGNFNDIAQLVTSALANGETDMAGEALQMVREPDQKLSSYHLLAAAYAVAAGRLAQAENEFSQAAAIEPKNLSIQLNLASLRLQSTNVEAVADARSTLEKLRSDPALRAPSLRALLADARRHGDSGNALRIATELATDPGATLEDKLALLEEIKRNGGADFDVQLKGVQAAVSGNPGLIRMLAHWMNAQGLAAQTLEWVQSLPNKTQSQPAVQLAMAESLSGLGKWENVREMLAKCNWQELNFLRFAIQARAARETMHPTESGEKWQNAITATKGDERMLSMLAHLVGGWGWSCECEQVWWLIARHNTGQHAALQSLYKLYSDAKNTRQLYLVIERIYEINPNDPGAVNNMAAVSLLLGKNLQLAHRLAMKNYRHFETNSWAVSTYAFSLYRRNRIDDGLRALRMLPEAVLRQPAIAVYYGILLAASGDRTGAQPFLKIAEQSRDLLPEEKELVTQVR